MLVGIAFVYAGFYFPDPVYYEDRGTDAMRVWLYALRVGIPLLVLAGAAATVAVKRKRLDRRLPVVGGVGVFLALLLFYPLAEHWRQSRARARLAEFHPFLQLDPPELGARAAAAQRPAYRIFCLGGSTTAWPDSQGVGWPAMVEKRLQGHSERYQAEVHNLGKEWYTSQHTLLNYLLNLRSHKPDLIVVMHAINDLLVNADFGRFSHRSFRGDYGHFAGPAAFMLKPRALTASVFDKLAAAWYHTPRQELDVHEFPGLVAFQRNIRSLIETASVDGTTVLLVTQPHLYKDAMTPEEQAAAYMVRYEAVGETQRWSLGTAQRGMNRYNQALRDLAAREAVGLVDLENAIPRSLEYFRDEVHYTDKSFPLLADAVAEAVRKHLAAGAPRATKRPRPR